jgi:hypothetical protein
MTSKKEAIERKEERKNRWCEGKTKRVKQRNGRKNGGRNEERRKLKWNEREEE